MMVYVVTIGMFFMLLMLITHVWIRADMAIAECDRLSGNNSVGFRELWDKIGETNDALTEIKKAMNVINGDVTIVSENMVTVSENMVTVTTFKGIEDRIALVESAVGQLEANQERTRELVHSLASALVVHRDAKGRYIKAVQPNE